MHLFLGRRFGRHAALGNLHLGCPKNGVKHQLAVVVILPIHVHVAAGEAEAKTMSTLKPSLAIL